VPVDIVFETHSLTEDNEAGRATGWLGGRLSAEGRRLAALLGARHGDADLAAVFSSDLERARETVGIAFSRPAFPVLFDWRLRECNYGELNGAPGGEVHADRSAFLHRPYPGGESWEQAVERVGWFLHDLRRRWDGSRVLVVGHVATRLGLEHWVTGVSLSELLVADFGWKEGWGYRLP
jgi:2,3-bisphosphoglycerate-dependent phosphoglycerate mutase